MSTVSQPQALPPILFIGGGNMSGAIICGLIASNVYTAKQIYVVDLYETQLAGLRAKYDGINTSTSITKEIIEQVGIVLIGTKPNGVPAVAKQLGGLICAKKHIVVSVCTGVSCSSINQYLTMGYYHINNTIPLEQQEPYPVPVIRVMPNTPALVQAATSAVCKGEFATENELNIVSRVMSAVGLVVPVNESDLNAVTGVSGSGPAYVLTFIEALTSGGVAAGLTYPVSYKLALETVYGTVKMLKDTQQHPAILREQICSPGGTTITGLKALHENGFTNAVMQCVLDANERAIVLEKAAKL